MTRSIEAVIEADGQIRLKRSVQLDRAYRAIVTILGPVEEEAVESSKETDSPSVQPEDLSRDEADAGVNRTAFPSVAPLLEELE